MSTRALEVRPASSVAVTQRVSSPAARTIRFTLATMISVVFVAAIGFEAYPAVADTIQLHRHLGYVSGISVVFWYAEIVWIALVVVWTVIIISRVRSLPHRLIVLASAACVVVAHRHGFKFYGSAIVYDNRPVLSSSHTLAAVTAPNFLVTDDGRQIEVPGVAFRENLLSLSHDDLLRVFDRVYDPSLPWMKILVEPTPSGVAFEWREEMFCGNIFYPTFFPRRIPRFHSQDVADHLIAYELATRH